MADTATTGGVPLPTSTPLLIMAFTPALFSVCAHWKGNLLRQGCPLRIHTSEQYIQVGVEV